MSADTADDEPAIRIRQPVVEQGRVLLELVSPPGWPWLPPPEPGEPLAAYLERALLKDSFYLGLCQKFWSDPRLRIAPFRPAQMTLSQWHERWPDRPIRRGYGDPTARPNYYPDMVLARLLVVLCDQLLAGEVELRGFRFSSLAEERVPLGLLRSDAVLLDPNIDDGRLRLPEGLPVYRELTLWPVGEGARVSEPVAAGAQSKQLPKGAPAAAPTLKEMADTFATKYPDKGQRWLWTEWHKDGTRPHISLTTFPKKERGRPRRKSTPKIQTKAP